MPFGPDPPPSPPSAQKSSSVPTSDDTRGLPARPDCQCRGLSPSATRPGTTPKRVFKNEDNERSCCDTPPPNDKAPVSTPLSRDLSRHFPPYTRVRTNSPTLRRAVVHTTLPRRLRASALRIVHRLDSAFRSGRVKVWDVREVRRNDLLDYYKDRVSSTSYTNNLFTHTHTCADTRTHTCKCRPFFLYLLSSRQVVFQEIPQ